MRHLFSDEINRDLQYSRSTIFLFLTLIQWVKPNYDFPLRLWFSLWILCTELCFTLQLNFLYNCFLRANSTFFIMWYWWNDIFEIFLWCKITWEPFMCNSKSHVFLNWRIEHDSTFRVPHWRSYKETFYAKHNDRF